MLPAQPRPINNTSPPSSCPAPLPPTQATPSNGATHNTEQRTDMDGRSAATASAEPQRRGPLPAGPTVGRRLGTCGYISGRVEPCTISLAKRPVDPRLDGGASVVFSGLRGSRADITELDERLRRLENAGPKPKPIVLPTATPLQFDPIPALPSEGTRAAVGQWTGRPAAADC